MTPAVHSAHTVLVVDDDEDIREALTQLFTSHGYTVHAAWGAEEALRQLRAGFRPCVSLVDLRMPGMDGWGLIERMRADRELAAIAVVVLSAHFTNMERADQLGVRQFITKPPEPGRLTAAVERHCRRRARRSPTM